MLRAQAAVGNVRLLMVNEIVRCKHCNESMARHTKLTERTAGVHLLVGTFLGASCLPQGLVCDAIRHGAVARRSPCTGHRSALETKQQASVCGAEAKDFENTVALPIHPCSHDGK